MKKILIGILLIASTLWAGAAGATTYYIATTGSDSAAGSEGAPWETFDRAFDSSKATYVSGGDDLVVKNGVYYESIDHADGIRIPSGSSGNYTEITAETDFGVELHYKIYIYDRSYIKIKGFRVIGNGGDMITLTACNHIKIMECGFTGGASDYNVHGCVINGESASNYNLFEDCYAWGSPGRYAFHSAQYTHHNIFRRCVVRYDYRRPFNADTGRANDQCSSFTRYDANNVEWQNCIAIDHAYPQAMGFWNEENPPTSEMTGKMLGCIVLNITGKSPVSSAVNDYKYTDGTRTVTNVVVWDCDTGINCGWGNNIYNHLTIGNISSTGFSSSTFFNGTCMSNPTDTIKNSLFLNSDQAFAASISGITSANCMYSVINGCDPIIRRHNEGYISQTIDASNVTTDPALKYLVDAGRDSDVTDGDDSEPRGATILYQYGVSGTLWGETGYETLTATALWPWPNEAQIRTDMRSYSDHGIDGARGFCANGTTLTKYIWEYLGETIPEDIYGAPPENASPVAGLSATPTSGTVPLEVSFTCTGTDSDGTIASWDLDYGDGTAHGTVQSPTHIYTVTGDYTATLTVTDDDSDTDTASVDISVASATGSTTWYVSTSGSDSTGDGTSGTPWRTLQKAADKIVDGTIVAGDTISVAAGTYTGFNIWSNVAGGTLTNPITFLASGTVTLNTVNADTDDIVNIENIDYITLDGFRVTGSPTGEGVRVVNSIGTVVQNCVVYSNSDRNIFAAWAPHLKILNNTCYSAAQEHGIYVSNSAGTVPVNDTPMIIGNTVYNNYQNGIQVNGDLDEGGDGAIEEAIISENVVFGNGWKGLSLISMINSTVENNVIYLNGNAAGGIHLSEEPDTGVHSTGNVIVNNTIIESQMAGIRFSPGSDGNQVFNNIVIALDPADYIIADEDGDNAISDTNYQSHSTTGLFTDYAARDFSLAGGSAAIDYGESAYSLLFNAQAPVTDIDGETRPQGGGYDSGAYEFPVAATPSGTATQSNTVTSYITLAAGGNRRVIAAFCVEENNTDNFSSVGCTLNGVAMTAIGSVTVTSSGLYMTAALFDIAEASLPPAAGTYAIVASTNGVCNELSLACGYFTGIDQGAITNVETMSETSGTTITDSITTTADGSTVVCAIGDGQPATFVAGNSQTIAAEADALSSTGALAYKVVSATGAFTNNYSGLSGYRHAMVTAELPAYVATDSTPPDAVTNLSLVSKSPSGESVVVKWTETGANGTTGTASSFDIRYKSGEWDWDTATEVTTEPSPNGAGNEAQCEIAGLSPGTAYTVAIKSSDEIPNVSAVSNLVTFTTRAVPVQRYCTTTGTVGEGAP